MPGSPPSSLPTSVPYGELGGDRETARAGCRWHLASEQPLLYATPHVAQFLAVCRRSKMVAMGTRRPRRGLRLCRRWVLRWREDGQLLGQCLRATKCDKLSEGINHGNRRG